MQIIFASNNDNSNWDRRNSKTRENTIIVQTSLGKILGLKDQQVNSFLGIPFAEPPTGEFRFRPPRVKRPWHPSVYRATSFSPECLQSSLFSSNDEERPRDEDCLYLNIWTPQVNRSSKRAKSELLPVLIWIYGGAFLHGGASLPEYNGNVLAATRGVIVVSFNYRLGALGFLVSTSDGLFGNYGLDDQKTAIQWVQDHIENFGGDPDRVTLFGESAGAMSIGLQLLDQQLHLDRNNEENDYSDEKEEEEEETFEEEVEEEEEEDYYLRKARAKKKSSGEKITYRKRKRRKRQVRKLFQAAIMQSNPLGYK
jgi:hypothetical protein